MFPHQFCLFIQNNIHFQLFLYIIKLKYALKKLHRKKIVNTSNYTSGLKHIQSNVFALTITIRLICLLAQSSHILQPFDVGVYCHVKRV